MLKDTKKPQRFLLVRYLLLSYTGRKSQFRKTFEFKIWKKPMLVLKQTIHQKKTLIPSFLELESLRAWHYQEGTTPTCHRKTFFPTPTYAFTARRHGTLLIMMPRPQNFRLQKPDYQSFLLRYRLFLCQQWFFQNIEKGWKKFLEMILFPQFPQNDEIYSKIIPQAFFNILKEPLLVQKQTIPHKKSSDTQLFGAGKVEGVA